MLVLALLLCGLCRAVRAYVAATVVVVVVVGLEIEIGV
jgi:hypothetical protein